MSEEKKKRFFGRRRQKRLLQEQKYISELQEYAEKLSSYKKAILSDALISLEADLSRDELYYGIWKDDDGREVPLADILGLQTPCSYDEYIKAWKERFVTGYSSESFSGSTDREYLLQTFENGSSEITFDYEAKTISGRKTWLRRCICMIRNQAGSVIAYTSVKDISALVEAEKREESYIRALATEYDSIAVVEFSPDKKDDTITLHSRVDGNLKEVLKSEFLEEKTFIRRVDMLCGMVHPDDREDFRKSISREAIFESFDSGRNHTVDFRIPDKNGESVYYQARFIPMRTDDGTLTGMIACLRNIDTEIKNEFGVRRELEEAKAAAEAASNAKSSFLFNMSHDIRTPMNAILGFTRIAQNHTDDIEQVKDCLHKIEVSGEQLLDLINDVLEMSRIESGKINTDFAPVRISDSFVKIDPMFTSLAMTKSIDYSASVGDISDDYVWMDAFHTSRIFTNIISNAIKYTPNGGKVKAHLEQISPVRSDGLAEYRFTVEDTGVGMSEEFLEHMYEEFARENTSTVSRQTGTGLGLSIVKKLTDTLGGSISVESSRGVGTKFEVILPLKPETEAEIAENHIVETGSGSTDNSNIALRGKRVLLAEDNELNREIACDILSENGLEIESAEDGKIAFDMYKEKGAGYYDFILMDIQMPVMDGYEATGLIRKHENGGRRVPIIATSANAFAEDIKRSLESGMDAHIAKPIDPAELVKVIKEFTV